MEAKGKPVAVQCFVRSNEFVTPTVFEVKFETDRPLEFKAGQFASVVVPGRGPQGRDLRRAYSIASTPETYPIELCVRLVEGGPATNYLRSLAPGQRFTVWAPYGTFTFKTPPDRHAVFIATGTGIAPFRAMIRSAQYAAAPPSSALCLFGVREQNELLYVNELSAHPHARWVPAVSRPEKGWQGFHGRVTDWLRAHGDEVRWLESDYYLCGNGAMIEEVKAMLKEKGVDPRSVHTEVYYK